MPQEGKTKMICGKFHSFMKSAQYCQFWGLCWYHSKHNCDVKLGVPAPSLKFREGVSRTPQAKLCSSAHPYCAKLPYHKGMHIGI